MNLVMTLVMNLVMTLVMNLVMTLVMNLVMNLVMTLVMNLVMITMGVMMMLLNELTTLGDIIDNIPTLQTETQDTRDSITSYIKSMYGQRTVFDSFVPSPGTAGKMIDLLFASKWTKIKEALALEIPLDKHDTHETEVKTTEIFGYDGQGTNDTRETTEHTGSNEIDNVFDSVTNGLEFYNNFSYYRIVIGDIVSQITLKVYE